MLILCFLAMLKLLTVQYKTFKNKKNITHLQYMIIIWKHHKAYTCRKTKIAEFINFFLTIKSNVNLRKTLF